VDKSGRTVYKQSVSVLYMNMSQSSRRGFVTYIENSGDFVVSL